jgi:oligopeptide transport system permease protein
MGMGMGDVATEPPAAPQNVRTMFEPITTGVALQWDPVPGIDGYRVYRSTSADTLGVPLEDVMPDTTSFLDTASLSAGTTYVYHIAAFNAFGDSTETAVISVTPKLALPLDLAQAFAPNAVVGDKILTRPHYLGTDYLGRDLLARVLVGARVSLFIGIVAPLLYILFGIVYGSISGYFGGVVDNIMMRVADVVVTVPELLVVILLQVMLGAGLGTLVVAIVIVSWARSAQQIRGEVLRLRETEFVHAAKVLGTSFYKTVFRHLLPNVMGTVLVVLTLAVPQAIFTEAFLSYIGLGIQPPMSSWPRRARACS